ncbi:MAG: PIN domain-containing protein [Planctomycetes bacterium]|nr:PIN domain-containing protein [Planctomycetota bacterium]
MVLHLVRVLFLLIVLGISIPLGLRAAETLRPGSEETSSYRLYVWVLIIAPVAMAFLLVLADMLWRRKRLQVLSGLFFGMLAGLVIAYGLTVVVDLVVNVFEIPEQPAIAVIKALLSVAVVYLCVSFVLQTKDDFRFVIPYVEFSRESRGARPLVLDTSVIIDGRIADIAQTGILESTLIVPRFVLTELHKIADSGDKLRRNRGRRGLDVLNQLQADEKLDVRLTDGQGPAVEQAASVDEKLVALAKHLDGRIVTNDYNLNKVARLAGVDVININDLANAMKPVVLPGETMRVKIIRPGEEPGQGVGYLDDGTMVVAEQGRDHIGREIAITVTSVLQTSAGRMIFGRAPAGPAGRGGEGAENS